MEDPEMGDFHGDFFGGMGGFNDFSDDGGGGPPMGPPMFRPLGRGGPWRGRGRGGHFDGNGFGPRGPPPRFRGRGGFMGGPPRHGGPRGFRGGHFDRPFGRPQGPGGWDGPPQHMMQEGGFPGGGGGGGGERGGGGGGAELIGPGSTPEHGGGGGGGTSISDGEEIWAETKTESGPSYFYNTKTRVTSWDRPEGPNIKIMSHEEFTTMMKGPSDSLRGGIGRSPSDNSHNDSPAFQGSQDSPAASQQGQGQFMQQQHSDAAGNAENGVLPEEKLDPAPMVTPVGMGLGMGVPRPTFSHQLPPGHPPGFPPFTGPPPGFGLPFPQNFPMVPPPWNAMSAVPPPVGVPAPIMDPILQHVDPHLVARAFEWTEHTAPDGKVYFYNLKTQMSVWEKPHTLIEFETAKIIAQQRLVQQALIAGAAAKESKSEKNDKTGEKGRERLKRKRANNGATKGAQAVARLDLHRVSLVQQIEAKRTAASGATDKCKPVSSTPVTGTPWCIVWTGDKRVFFYNPSTKSSVWEKPPELLGRLDVEELLRGPGAGGQKVPTGPVKKAEATSTSESAANANHHSNSAASHQAAAVSPVMVMDTKITIQLEKRGRDKEEGGSGGEPPEKKVKKDVVDLEGNGDSQEVITIEDDKEEKRDPLKEANALEAEVKAARERAIVPLETRLKQFKEMLVEKQVSAFSTWEKELHKIVFDSRYLLLTSKERKAAFDDYVKERALEERREKKARFAQLKERFMKFLEDVHVHQKMSYNEFAQKYSRDERFKEVEKSRERESYFSEFIGELKKKERDARKVEKDKTKETFTDALQERIKDYHVRWVDVKKKFDDPKFSILDSEEKEELFRSFQKRLKSEMKSKERKKKKKSRSEKKNKKDKERGERHKQGQGEEEKVVAEQEQEEVEEGETPDSEKSDAEGDGGAESDKMEDVSEEEEPEDGAVSEESDEEGRIKKQKAEHSIREREKEVQRTLATHLRDRDKERDFYKHEEAVQEMQAILTDVIRSSDITWKEAKKSVKKDRRWAQVSNLSREEMEEIFNQHLENIVKKKKLRFRDLLQEARVKLNSSWKDVRRKIRDDPRFQKYSGDERKCEREFHLYLKDLVSNMKSDFRGLLKETKMLTYKTKHHVRENPQIMRDIEAVLEKDKRFLNLETMPDDRRRLLGEYLEELERKGPPPPPTATDKISRRVK